MPSATRVSIALLCLVLLLGTLLRVRQFLLRAPFWRDEAFIVLNIRELPAGHLLGPLKYDQAAPPGFLLLEHAMFAAFGDGEYSLRVVSLVSGLAAMGVMACLAWRLLGPEAAIVATGLMAFCQTLIEYSAQVKQYSGDVCTAALMLLVALGWEGTPIRRLWRSAVAAAILVWFSHPTVILFAAISIVLSIEAWRSSVIADRLSSLWPNMLFVGSFALLYAFSIRREHTGFLYDFWSGYFPDWSHPGRLIPWLLRQTSQWLNEPFHAVGYLLALLAIAAAMWLSKRRRHEVWIIAMLPLGLTLLAACVRQYPYGGSRLTLFTLPGFFLLAAAGGEAIRQWLPPAAKCAWCVLPACVIGYGISRSIDHVIHPVFKSYVTPAVAYLQQHREPDEPIYCLGEPTRDAPGKIFTGRHIEILCYWPQAPGKVETDVQSIDRITGDRFWIFVPFDSEDGVPALKSAMNLFAPIATPVSTDAFIDPRGGAAILYTRDR